jgi:hypothetical protein
VAVALAALASITGAAVAFALVTVEAGANLRGAEGGVVGTALLGAMGAAAAVGVGLVVVAVGFVAFFSAC